jgi:hypothetical protein
MHKREMSQVGIMTWFNREITEKTTEHTEFTENFGKCTEKFSLNSQKTLCSP